MAKSHKEREVNIAFTVAASEALSRRFLLTQTLPSIRAVTEAPRTMKTSKMNVSAASPVRLCWWILEDSGICQQNWLCPAGVYCIEIEIYGVVRWDWSEIRRNHIGSKCNKKTFGQKNAQMPSWAPSPAFLLNLLAEVGPERWSPRGPTQKDLRILTILRNALQGGAP